MRTQVVISPAPTRPTGLQAAPGNGRVTLTWDDPGKGIYIEFYRYTADGGATWTDIPGSETTVQGQLTRYTVPNLTNGQAYTFAILAENDTGASPPSAAVTATPRAAAPAKPTGLSAAPGNAEATLAWDDPHDASIARYQVRQGNANWADISGSGASTTSHTVGTLTNGASYTFRIRAVNDHDGDGTDDPGAASDAVTVTPGVPAGPGQLQRGPRRHPGDARLGGAGQRQRQRRHRLRIQLERGRGHARLDRRPGQRLGRPRRRNRVHGDRSRQQHHLRLRGAGGERQRAGRRHADPPGRARASRRAATAGGIEGESGPSKGVAHLVAAVEPEPSGDLLPVPAERRRARDLEPGLDRDRRQRRRHGRAPARRPRQRQDLHLRAPGPEGQHRRPRGQGAGHPEPRRGQGGDNPLPFRRGHDPGRQRVHGRSALSPAGLNWRIVVPGTTEIDGRAFTIRSLQGTTPETSQRYRFTGAGQEGLDIEVDPPLTGPVQVCLEPTEALRQEAGGRPLLLLRYDGAWTPLSTAYEDGMACANVSSFSAFVLGYAVDAAGGGTAPGPRPDFGTAAVPDQGWTEGTRIAPLTLPAATGGGAPADLQPDAEPAAGGLPRRCGAAVDRNAGARAGGDGIHLDGAGRGWRRGIAYLLHCRGGRPAPGIGAAGGAADAGALARRATSGALDTIGARFGDIGASSLTLGGRAMPLDGFGSSPDGGAYMAGADTACPARGSEHGGFGAPSGCAAGLRSQGMEVGELMRTSAFSLPLGASEGAPGAPLWSVWGGGDFGSFAGRGDNGIRYDGDLRTGWLGMDARFGRWLAGLALSHGEGEADYGFAAGGLSGEGRLNTSLTAVYPYGRWTFADGLELRGVVGAGQGELRHSYGAGNDEETTETGDLSMRMASAGARQPLADIAASGSRRGRMRASRASPRTAARRTRSTA